MDYVNCKLCPRECYVNRTIGETGYCRCPATALVAKAMKGIKVGVSLLILSVGLNMLGKMQKKPFPRIVCGCAFGFMLLNNLLGLGFSTISLMIVAGFAGFLFFKFGKGGGKK